MSTDLRAALRDAVADPPPDPADVRGVIDTGSRRLRRRSALTASAAALAVAAVVVALVVVPGADRHERRPMPAEIVRLDLDAAEQLDLGVLTSRRTVWRESMTDFSHDRFDGLTADGLVLRSRQRSGSSLYEFGLLEPATGQTDWLPRPPGELADPDVIALTADRLVLFDGELRVVVVLDRESRTWTRASVRMPGGLEVHAPPQLRASTDGRLYLGHTRENTAEPLRWWSYPLSVGGDPRPEPGLRGLGVTWVDGTRVTAGNEGRVVVSVAGVDRTVADRRPVGCPAGPVHWSPIVGLAGDRPVVTYWCRGLRPGSVTVVYDADGGRAVQIPGLLLAADGGHVLLSGGSDDGGGIFLLELDPLRLDRLGPGRVDVGEEVGAESLDELGFWNGAGNKAGGVGLADGLVLWSTIGPTEDRKTYDAVWKVARLP